MKARERSFLHYATGARRYVMGCFRGIGPGVITGAADDDPSGIATYAIVGATMGYEFLWVALLTAPMMIVVQGMCARIALVSGQGLAQALRSVMPLWLLRILVFFVVAANTLNIAADFAGLSSSAALITPISSDIWCFVFAALLICIEVFSSYAVFALVVKWLCLSLCAYILNAFVVGVDWFAALRHTLIPEIHFERSWMALFVGFLGTTITPYLFFWQAAQEIEEERAIGRDSIDSRQGITTVEMQRSTRDVTLGMIFSNLVSWFIVLTTAATLHVHHITIVTVSDAARALKPLAGDAAQLLFSLGVIGAGLLAIPVIAGSSAYALAEVFGWKNAGLNEKLAAARPFYAVVVFGMAAGAAANVLRLDTVKMLFWSAVVNGFVAIPLLIGVFFVGNHHALMGAWKNTLVSNIWMLLTIVLMTLAAIGMILTT